MDNPNVNTRSRKRRQDQAPRPRPPKRIISSDSEGTDPEVRRKEVEELMQRAKRSLRKKSVRINNRPQIKYLTSDEEDDWIPEWQREIQERRRQEADQRQAEGTTADEEPAPAAAVALAP